MEEDSQQEEGREWRRRVMGRGYGEVEGGGRMKGRQGEDVEGRWGEERGEGGDGGKWGGAAFPEAPD